MKPRPLPKTVTPLADELLSGWLTRLAVTNHCEVDELLAHAGHPTRFMRRLFIRLFHTDLPTIQWVVLAYLLTITSQLLT